MWDRVSTVQAAGQEQFPDWDAVMTSEHAKTFHAPALLQAIYELPDSALSAKALHLLATDESVARQLADLPPLAAAAELGRYLASSAASSGPATSASPVSRAKPLIKPVGASPVVSASGPPDPEKTSFADWVKINNQAERRQRALMKG